MDTQFAPQFLILSKGHASPTHNNIIVRYIHQSRVSMQLNNIIIVIFMDTVQYQRNLDSITYAHSKSVKYPINNNRHAILFTLSL